MKKLFLLAAIIFIGAYINFSNASVPAIMEKKITYENGKSVPEIRVMTYNIHRGINRDNKLDLDGIAEVIKSSGAEVIALQEVERFSVRTKFQDQIGYIADKLSMQYAFGKSINILNGQFGNAILSKYPIEEYQVIELPSVGERRTLLRATLNMNGKRISFYNTHLGLKQSEREAQVGEVMRRIGDKDFVLAGDFNTTLDKLGAVTNSCKDSASFGNNTGKATFEKESFGERIDYIFTSKNFRIKKYDVLKSDASDHYPVISTLKLGN